MLASTICFVVCHTKSAEDFVVFAEELRWRGHEVVIYAADPATVKLKGLGFQEFSIKEGVEVDEARRIARLCNKARVVLADVAHPGFSEAFQKALKEEAPGVKRYVWYDNRESFVPGGYSATVARVVPLADQVLFANSLLVEKGVYGGGHESIPLKRARGIGFYDMFQVKSLIQSRENESEKYRLKFFSESKLIDRGQPIFVYMGGNNNAYFDEAFPAFLRCLGESIAKEPSVDSIILIQQHPGAKSKGIEGELIEEWREIYGDDKERRPQFVISTIPTFEALIIARCVFYYQTSMIDQFMLASIPTIQVGKTPYVDIAIRNKLCPFVSTGDELLTTIKNFSHNNWNHVHEVVRKNLGFCEDWADRLEDALVNL